MGMASWRLHVETVQYVHVTGTQIVIPHPGWQAVPSTFWHLSWTSTEVSRLPWSDATTQRDKSVPTFQRNCVSPITYPDHGGSKSSAMSASPYQTTWHHTYQDTNLHHHYMKTSHLASISIWYPGKQTLLYRSRNSEQCVSLQRNKRSVTNTLYSPWPQWYRLYIVKIHHCINVRTRGG